MQCKNFLFFILLFLSLYQLGTATAVKHSFTKDTIQQSNSEQLKIGKNLYNKHCVICYGIKGKGDGNAGLLFTPPPFDLTSKKIQEQTDNILFEKTAKGEAPMPSFANLSNEE